MKLMKSVKPLRDAVNALPDIHGKQALAEAFANKYEHCKVKCVNPMLAMRWNVWFTLDKQVRDNILMYSVGDKDYVGGYFQSVNDSHIDSLLRKALPHSYMARMLASAQLLAAKQGR